MGKITGRVDGGTYVIFDPNGGIILQVPLSEVTDKLRKSVIRNKWPAIPEI